MSDRFKWLRPEDDPEAENLKHLAEGLGMEFVSLRYLQVNQRLLHLLSADIARELVVFPIAETAVSVKMAVADPLDASIINTLELLTDRRIVGCLAKRSEIVALIEKHYGGPVSPPQAS
jgi:hypothetical protein